jgi:hypothetical protein
MFFVVDPDKEVSPQHSALVWQHVWAMRDLAPVGALLPAAVSSPCPLLPSEAASGVLVSTLTPVPDNSAWVPLEIDLSQYLGRDGAVERPRLDRALRAAVTAGERGHDEARWPVVGQQLDSHANRRLAILVRGWGDVVASGQVAPDSLAALRKVQDLVEHVAATLIAASRSIAATHGHCPALDISGARVRQHGEEMSARWCRAVGENAVRHRNLLALSAWDVFPRHEPADFRYTNLLPILTCANSVSFRREVDISHWNVKEFKGFFERVNAILRRSGERSAIAKQV